MAWFARKYGDEFCANEKPALHLQGSAVHRWYCAEVQQLISTEEA